MTRKFKVLLRIPAITEVSVEVDAEHFIDAERKAIRKFMDDPKIDWTDYSIDFNSIDALRIKESKE